MFTRFKQQLASVGLRPKTILDQKKIKQDMPYRSHPAFQRDKWLQESKIREAMNRQMLLKQAALKAGKAGNPPGAPRAQPQRVASPDLLQSQLSGGYSTPHSS
ncbi:hypothetical protein RRG08_033382 [Elysia crispata]|uniref:Uncharacterized protein n=1 Tax=Elysia crispata TaxID=231223 RepID=A0AAE1D6I5_9GAST|nr:hypothetical protein RRG08_033382 [Elysia crispata]